MLVYGLWAGKRYAGRGGQCEWKIIIRKKSGAMIGPCTVYKWNNMLLKWSIHILKGIIKRLTLTSIERKRAA